MKERIQSWRSAAGSIPQMPLTQPLKKSLCFRHNVIYQAENTLKIKFLQLLICTASDFGRCLTIASFIMKLLFLYFWSYSYMKTEMTILCEWRSVFDAKTIMMAWNILTIHFLEIYMYIYQSIPFFKRSFSHKMYTCRKWELHVCDTDFI